MKFQRYRLSPHPITKYSLNFNFYRFFSISETAVRPLYTSPSVLWQINRSKDELFSVSLLRKCLPLHVRAASSDQHLWCRIRTKRTGSGFLDPKLFVYIHKKLPISCKAKTPINFCHILNIILEKVTEIFTDIVRNDSLILFLILKGEIY